MTASLHWHPRYVVRSHLAVTMTCKLLEADKRWFYRRSLDIGIDPLYGIPRKRIAEAYGISNQAIIARERVGRQPRSFTNNGVSFYRLYDLMSWPRLRMYTVGAWLMADQICRSGDRASLEDVWNDVLFHSEFGSGYFEHLKSWSVWAVSLVPRYKMRFKESKDAVS